MNKEIVNEKERDKIAPNLMLFYNPECPYCKKVLGFLEKINKDIPKRNTASDLNAKNELMQVGGKTQVPCLLINGKALYESQDIINWFLEHQNELQL